MPAKYTTEKTTGAHYTPSALAAFVADRILAHFTPKSTFDVLDPAMGDGALLEAICEALSSKGLLKRSIIHGFDTNPDTLAQVSNRCGDSYKFQSIDLRIEDFLDHALKGSDGSDELALFDNPRYDLVIANPPYVRTQVLGAKKAQELADSFGLDGRVDLSSAFIIGIGRILSEGGIAGIIVSNRFMKTVAGASVRTYLAENFDVLEVWDFGDTKLFEAAVLPAVLILRRRMAGNKSHSTRFCSIYTTNRPQNPVDRPSLFEAIGEPGDYRFGNGQTYRVSTGSFRIPEETSKPWRLSTTEQDDWLEQVRSRTAFKFGDVGSIRVGVKTTADSVFINPIWQSMHESVRPELVRLLITHHGASRWQMSSNSLSSILYTHELRDGKRRAVDLSKFPRAAAYLEGYKTELSARKYVEKAGRNWYEIWVPQDPAAWAKPKIVFRDICESPTFWMDLTGAVVNGDCYWFIADGNQSCELLWLALAIANSRFIEEYYDHMFNNKLYAGRRRFMTQYVEQFPLCDPRLPEALRLIELAKSLHSSGRAEGAEEQREREQLIRTAFGL